MSFIQNQWTLHIKGQLVSLLITVFLTGSVAASPYVFTTDTTVDSDFFITNNLVGGFTVQSGVTVTWEDTSGVFITGSITVENSATLDISDGSLLYLSLIFTNNGTVNNNGHLLSFGTLTNNNSLTNNLWLYNYATFTNNGTLTNTQYFYNQGGTLQNNGVLQNNNTVALSIGSRVNGVLVAISHFPATHTRPINFIGTGVVIPILKNGNTIVTSGGTITPAQCVQGFLVDWQAKVTISANVSINSNGRVLVFPDSQGIATSLTIASKKVLTNKGFLKIWGTLSNSGTINNSGWVSNSNIINNNKSGIINNKKNAILDNLNIVNNSGTINNNKGATINNFGTISSKKGSHLNNSGTINTATAGVAEMLVTDAWFIPVKR